MKPIIQTHIIMRLKEGKIKMRRETESKPINTNTHISRLDAKIQRKISYQLKQCGLFEEDIQMLMNGRLRDLEDNIELSEVFA